MAWGAVGTIVAAATDAGTVALVGGVVTLFGTATMLLIKVGDRSEKRSNDEIARLRADKDAEFERLQKDKDATILALRAERDDARKDRDHWLGMYAKAIGHPLARSTIEGDGEETHT